MSVPRPDFFLSAVSWVQSSLDSRNWGPDRDRVRGAGGGGGIRRHELLVADACKLELSAGTTGNRKYESWRKGAHHTHKDSLKFRPGGNYKLFTM